MPKNQHATPLRVTMVTPHLPPTQAANALLPVVIASALDSVEIQARFITHPPAEVPEVCYVSQRGRGLWARTPMGGVTAAIRIALLVVTQIAASDVVHLHGNGLLVEVANWLAVRFGKPRVITLYGTDIWHHDPVRHRQFGQVVRQATTRVFYSQGLLDFARDQLDLAVDPSEVIHAPVAPSFHEPSVDERRTLRAELGLHASLVLLTVKRLHPVAGYEDLLRAMPAICVRHPDVQLLIVGEGESRFALETLARELQLSDHIQFLGSIPNGELWRYYASADLFVLPSRLESWGTVMLEALACGTPVVATDTAGGCEVAANFPDDVQLTLRENPEVLASTVIAAAESRRQTSQATQSRLLSEFGVEACAAHYATVYRSVSKKL